MRTQSYQIANKSDSRKIAEFLSKDGQLLLPFLELISNTEQAVDEVIDVVGKAAIEAVLLLSAQQIAGPKQPGKAKDRITWHGRQHGVVALSQRRLRVEKPRLRRKGTGSGKEVLIPAGYGETIQADYGLPAVVGAGCQAKGIGGRRHG